MLRKLLIILLLFQYSPFIFAQITLPSPGGNKKASVSEWIGITKVTINYDRPGVKGREGKIWGQLVHYGFKDLHYGTSKAAPWRAGANQNTTIEFSTDVIIEGHILPAGTYGFFIAMGPEIATLVFSNFNTAWGSFYYDPGDDALRVEVPVIKRTESVEWLKYEFGDQTETSAVVSLQWEKVKIPFTISVDLPHLQIASFRREFNSGEFYRYWQNMNTAARYCLDHNMNLEEGLSWAERSIHTFFGEANFLTLSTYAGLLEKLERNAEADSVMRIALPMASPQQVVRYGLSLNKMNRHREAFNLYKKSYDRNPGDNFACLGMVAGYYFLKDNREALKYAELAMKANKDPYFTGYFETLITDLKAGRELFQ